MSELSVIIVITRFHYSTFLDFVKSYFGFTGNIYRREVRCVYNIKDRLSALGKSQVWLLQRLRNKGVSVQPPQLCNIINGIYTYPKATVVLEECNNILQEYETTVTNSE